MTYQDRLDIPHDGSTDIELYSKTGEHIATGYDRIVFGGRGPYIEFTDQLIYNNLYVPKDLQWKTLPKYVGRVAYFEFRSITDYVKVYFQRKTVSYADYLVDKFYISPFDLYNSDRNVLIEKIRG